MKPFAILKRKVSSPPLFPLDFTGGSLPAGVTLTRASSGTRVNASGALVTETTNVARFDYDPITLASRGLLVEAQDTNSLLYSSDFTSRSSVLAGATSNTQTSPSGATDADTLTATAGSGRHINYTSLSYVAGRLVHSVFMKQGTARYAQVQVNDGVSKSLGVLVDLQTGSVADVRSAGSPVNSAYAVEAYGNGWYRVSAGFDVSSGGTTYPIVAISDSAAPTYDGDGNPTFNAAGTETIYLWGEQHSAAASSYIATTSTSLTRSAEVVSFTIPSGVATLRYTFDDASTQDVSVSPGAYTVPTTLNRPRIKTIVSI